MFCVANLSWELVISQLILGPVSGKKLQRLREAQYLADGGRATFLSAFWESQTALASSLSSVGASPELRQHSGSVIFVWHWKDLQKVIKQHSVLRNPTVYSKVSKIWRNFSLRNFVSHRKFFLINGEFVCLSIWRDSVHVILRLQWLQIGVKFHILMNFVKFYKFDFSRQNCKVSFNFN